MPDEYLQRKNKLLRGLAGGHPRALDRPSSLDRITLIDFKTGRVGYLADKYRLQMIRYRTILQSLFPGRSIEGDLLFVDEPRRIVTV